MFPSVEIRHLLAVIALAEELNFRRAAERLHITQPALSKQITDLEAEHEFHLFTRDKRRIVELTDAGRLFVEEARSALSHTERAVHLARAAHNGSDNILMIGRSPYANHDWVTELLAIRLPLYPRLEIRLKTQFARESVHSVLVGEVNLALVTAPPQDAQITVVPFAPAPLYAVLPENHPAAHKERLVLQDLAKDEWILFPKRFDPVVFEAIMDAAQCGKSAGPAMLASTSTLELFTVPLFQPFQPLASLSTRERYNSAKLRQRTEQLARAVPQDLHPNADQQERGEL